MSAAWVFQALAVAALMSVAALAAERVATWLAAPARGAWAVAMLATLSLAMLPILAPGLLPRLGILPNAPRAIGALDGLGFAAVPDAASSGVGAADVAASSAWSAGMLLVTAWAAATVAMLVGVAWTYWRFRRLRAGAARTVVEGISVRVAERAGPAVMGLLRPEIVLPGWVLELPQEERRLIVQHEREHLAGRDSWLLFAATVTVALIPWCVPLWWQHKRLRQAIETDCDARVLARGANRRSYGRILIRTASTTQGLPLLNPAWGESTSQLERRIMRMTAKAPRHPILRSLPLAGLVLGIVATACDVAGRGPTDAQTATAPAPQGEEVKEVVYNAPPGEPQGDMGIRGWSWPDHGGPSFAGGTPRFPTSHVVIEVREGGPAWNAGLRNGDVLVAVNGIDTRKMMHPFPDVRPGTRYAVRARRGEQEHEFALEIGPPRR